MLSRITANSSDKVDLIFLDTLFHFQETLDLVERVKVRYPEVRLHVFKPDGVENAADFERKYGERLWETDDSLYDYLAKIEPAHRAYAELEVKAVLTGRRRSQGGQRGDLDIVEVDEAGLLKINPLANWTFPQVKDYITKHNIPYNSLLDKGYKSIGDWHSTRYLFLTLTGLEVENVVLWLTLGYYSPVKEGEDERAGRWKDKKKTECGIHNPRSKYFEFLRQQELKKQEEELQRALDIVQISQSDSTGHPEPINVVAIQAEAAEMPN